MKVLDHKDVLYRFISLFSKENFMVQSAKSSRDMEKYIRTIKLFSLIRTINYNSLIKLRRGPAIRPLKLLFSKHDYLSFSFYDVNFILPNT